MCSHVLFGACQEGDLRDEVEVYRLALRSLSTKLSLSTQPYCVAGQEQATQPNPLGVLGNHDQLLVHSPILPTHQESQSYVGPSSEAIIVNKFRRLAKWDTRCARRRDVWSAGRLLRIGCVLNPQVDGSAVICLNRTVGFICQATYSWWFYGIYQSLTPQRALCGHWPMMPHSHIITYPNGQVSVHPL